jgi:hypothetical protein
MAKSRAAKHSVPRSSVAQPATAKNPFAQNVNYNQQTRKVLAKHYRAKFGVK